MPPSLVLAGRGSVHLLGGIPRLPCQNLVAQSSDQKRTYHRYTIYPTISVGFGLCFALVGGVGLCGVNIYINLKTSDRPVA